MSELKMTTDGSNGHYGCNQNGEHERCSSCGVYSRCNVRSTMWFGEEIKRITNADKIRSMSDGELAWLIAELLKNECGVCFLGKSPITKESILKVLQSEVKESETE